MRFLKRLYTMSAAYVVQHFNRLSDLIIGLCKYFYTVLSYWVNDIIIIIAASSAVDFFISLKLILSSLLTSFVRAYDDRKYASQLRLHQRMDDARRGNQPTVFSWARAYMFRETGVCYA